ncbi:MAG: DoxX family membrane protein [Verrucomicrobiota bacterium]|nr:DoxX family membrane protein [Verrucomicrobiota bacterium]
MNSSSHVQSPLMQGQERATPRPIFWWAIAVVIGGIFIYAGATKIWDPMAFANDISNYRILSWPLGIRLAFYLPWLEILCGLALIFGRLRAGAVAILLALTLVFIAASIVARARGIDLNCGCFGSAGKGLGFTAHLLIDFAILAALVALTFSPLTSRGIARV